MPSNTPRLYAIICADCHRAIAFTFDRPQSQSQSQSHVLCYSCMESHSRVADFLRSDGKEHAQIELRRFDNPVLSYHMANDCISGLQTAIVLRMKSATAIKINA